MKKIIFILLLFCSCEEEEVTDLGCQTGIYKGTTDRVFMRCATRQQYMAGDNVNAGGISYSRNYDHQKWEKCDRCK